MEFNLKILEMVLDVTGESVYVGPGQIFLSLLLLAKTRAKITFDF